MSEHEEMITQFCDVTGIDVDRAKFYLEASNWELASAMSSFYEGDQELVAQPTPPPPPQATLSSSDEEMDDRPLAQVKADEAKSSKKAKPKSRFGTLSNLKSSDEDEEQGQAFYAGGSTTSGQQVLGPPKKNPIKDYVSDIFKLAQEGNIETFEPEAGSSSGGGGGGRLYFGTGYRLGQTPDDQVVIKGPTRAAAAKATDSDDEEDLVVLKLWREGFSVDDGDLKRYDDPVNKEFFDSIRRGEIPKELRKKGEKIHVDFEDHRHENFVQPKRKFKAFIGSGNMLGSPAPDVTTNTTTTPAAPSATVVSGDVNAENEQRAMTGLNVDQNLPTTMLQIRLTDGSRLSARFNLTHTVDNIRRYVISARPQYSSQTFMLLTTFPSKELTEGGQTIEEAGLKNAAILQRLK